MTDTVVAEKSRRRRLLDSGSTCTCNINGPSSTGTACLATWTCDSKWKDSSDRPDEQNGCTNTCDGWYWCLTGDDWCRCDPPEALSTGGSSITGGSSEEYIDRLEEYINEGEQFVAKLQQDLAAKEQEISKLEELPKSKTVPICES